MTVNTTTRRDDYIGNGATAIYSYNFRIFDETELLVTQQDTSGIETTLSYPADYSVSGVGEYAGGSITLTAGNLPAGYMLTIRRKLALLQETDLRNQGGYFADVQEDALDRLIMIALQHQDEIDRSVKLPETESGSMTLPTSTQRASRFLAFDAAGDPIAATALTDGVAVTPFMETVLDDTTAAAALTTLGVSAFIQTLLNDADAATARTTLGAVGLTGNESVAGKKTFADAATFSAVSYFTAGLGPQYMQNIRVAASVAAKALTIALKGKDGNDPSATNVVELSFRSITATSGAYETRQVTSAQSIVVPSGATLGFTAGETGLVYVYECDDGTTREMGVAKKALFDEGRLHSTTAITTGSDSDSVLYTTNAMPSAAVRLVCRLTIQTGAVAGEWDNAHTLLEMWTPAMKKTGDVLQDVLKTYGAIATGINTIPNDNTSPQNTEGDEYMASDSFTPRVSTNVLEVEAQAHLSHSSASNTHLAIALFQDSSASAVAVSSEASYVNGNMVRPCLIYRRVAGSTAATVFKVRGGDDVAGTTSFNGLLGTARYNGTISSYIRIREIQA